MKIEHIAPESFNWDNLHPEKVDGATGHALIKTKLAGSIKVRQVEYSSNYIADHWCDKGHIVFVLSGELVIEHKDKSMHTLKSGSTYVIGDDTLAHKAKSMEGATVYIVD